MIVRLIPNNNWLKESGYSKQEEIETYNDQIQEVIDDPGWYLQNLDYMTEYRLSWGTYTTKRITIPKKRKAL